MDKKKVRNLVVLAVVGAIVVSIAYVSFFRQRQDEKIYMLMYVLVQGCLFLAPVGCILFEVRKWLHERGYYLFGDLLNIVFYGVIIVSVVGIIIS